MARRETLSVWMHGRVVASLTRERDRLSLSYTEEAQRAYDVNTPLISVSLPLLPQTFKDDKVRPFFDGLLPEGEWALPIDGLPSTHILKRANPRFEHMVSNEAFCLAIGRHLGLRVAETTIMDLPEPVLVVSRYDRIRTANGEIVRVHQEDAAQALSIGASAKYEEHGGPSLRRLARLLRHVTSGSESLEGLLDMTLLNMVVGNADAHAKNFSLLHPEPGLVRLAPAYDIMSTTWYPRADVRPGMYVNGKTSLHDILTTDVIEEAVSWGFNRGRASTRVADLLERLPDALEAAAEDVPSVPEELAAHVRARADAFMADAVT